MVARERGGRRWQPPSPPWVELEDGEENWRWWRRRIGSSGLSAAEEGDERLVHLAARGRTLAARRGGGRRRSGGGGGVGARGREARVGGREGAGTKAAARGSAGGGG